MGGAGAWVASAVARGAGAATGALARVQPKAPITQQVASALIRTASWYHARLVRAACSIATAFALFACAEAQRGPLVGVSDSWKHADAPPAAPAPPPSRVWEGHAQLLREQPINPASFDTRGHQPEQSVDVIANSVARASYESLVADTVFPDGSLLAERSHGGTGHSYVMLKQAGAWTYLELDEQGAVLASGTPKLCVGCHAQAAADRVFGLPRLP